MAVIIIVRGAAPVGIATDRAADDTLADAFKARRGQEVSVGRGRLTGNMTPRDFVVQMRHEALD